VQGFVSGLGLGGVYAFLGVYLCTMYRLIGVVSLGMTAVAGFGATITAILHGDGWPTAAACAAGLGVAASASAACGWIMARFFAGASVDKQSAVTIAFLLTTLGAAQVAFGATVQSFPAVIQGRAFAIGGVTVTSVTLVCVAAALALAIAVPLVIRHTALGTRLIAISERPATAELLGIRTSPVAISVWLLGGVLVALLLLLVAPSIPNDSASLALLIVPACTAALVGALRRLGWALAGGLALGGVQGSMSLSKAWATWSEAVPMVVIAAVLLWNERREVWDAAR